MKEIEQIIAAYDEWLPENKAIALASVVRVAGSSYRRIGARMLVREDGQWVGGISGGCLEGDALKRANAAILNQEPSLVVYDTTTDDATQIGVGLGCQGRIEILFVPLDPEQPYNPMSALKKLAGLRKTSILMQAIQGQDVTRLGAVFTHAAQSEMCEYLGLDPKALKASIAEVERLGRSKPYTISAKAGGAYEVLIEWLPPKIRLLLIGDNYDVNASISLGHAMGWEVIACGKKIGFNRIAYQYADQIVPLKKLEDIPLDAYTAVVLMTHDLATDVAVLPYLLGLDLPYLGILGPKKRLHRIEEQLGLPLAEKTHLYSPVGLDIGAQTPDEIALAIAAEVLAVFRNRQGTSLKWRPTTIYHRE